MSRQRSFLRCHNFRFAAAVLLMCFVSASFALAQSAFVYVSSSPSQNQYQINAFRAASNGKLTPVQGSPFPASVLSMAVNSKYLFGTDDVHIYSFSIASDGALQQVSSINAQRHNQGDCGGPVALFLDHTGSTLYDEDFYGNICANNPYQFFTVDNSTGQLTYLGVTDAASPAFNVPLSFTGNNDFAYSSTCYHINAWLFGFQRSSDGSLTEVNNNPAMPKAQKEMGFCPFLASGDPTNHVAVSVQEYNGSWQPVAPPQIATYTADSSGNLTTKSTYWNMPTSAVNEVTDIMMSPSGKLIAVGGTGGLQIFHFNGAQPATHYTALLTRDAVDQFFWDNDNHLYAISHTAGKLFVFTITPMSVKQAQGSPYSISNPDYIIVLPKK